MGNSSGIDFGSIPTIGWISVLIFGIVLIVVVAIVLTFLMYWMLKKNIKTKLFEIVEAPKQQERELFIAEGKDQLDNQCQVAKQLLKKIRIRLYEAGITKFDIKDRKDLEILELITYRIADRLNYDVRNDLTRNHITKKTDSELKEYSDAKAKGYYFMMYDRLYNMNARLPEFELPKILDLVPEAEIKSIFYDIYFSARSIAGLTGDKTND